MKKFLMILLLGMGFISGAMAQNHYIVQVGNGTSTSAYAPDYTYYNFAYSQMLYTANEVGIDGDIDTIYFQVNSGSTTRTLTIYMAEVSQTSFSGTSDAVAASAFTQVFSGSVSWSSGWVAIPLDTTFSYQDTGSLVIACIDSTGSWVSSPYYLGTNMSNTRVLHVHSDYDTYTLSSTLSSTYNFLPNLMLGINSYSTYCANISNLTVSNVDADSAHISWHENGIASEWEVLVSDTAVTDFTNVYGVTVYDSSYTVTGLNGNTSYYVYVRAVCTATDYSGWSSAATFTSACSGYTSVPYSSGFEGFSTGDLPNCWLAIASGSSSASTFPSVYNHGPNTRNGTGYFEFESSTGETEIAALPAMEDINTLQLEMYISTNNGSVVFEVGVMEDTTFVTVDTLSLTTNGGNWHNGYNLYTTYFDQYSGYGERIAMRATHNGQYTIMIDDLTVSAIPGCIQPSGFAVVGVGTDSVALGWTEMGTASDWEIYYDTTLMDSINMNGTTVQAYDDTVSINGLAGGVTYYFYVRANCGGDYSAWVGPITATPNTWTMASNQTDTIFMCGGVVYDDGGANDNYSNSQNSVLVIYPSDTTSQGVILTGNYNIENNYDHLYIYNGDSITGTLLGDYSGNSSLNVASTASNGALTIKVTSDDIVSYSGFALTVSCFNNSCAAVDSLAIDSIDASSITLSWVAMGTETAWEIQYDTVSFTWGDSNATILSASTNPYTISGLNANTRYYFAVAADCGGTQSLPLYIDARTACSGYESIPYTTSFEGLSNNEMPSCWMQLATGTSGAGTFPGAYVHGPNARTGSVYFEMESNYGETEIATLPEMDSISYLKVELYAASTSYLLPTAFEVGVIEGTTFVPVDTIALASTSSFTYNPYTVYMAGYTGTGNRIALRTTGNGSSSYTLFVDDLTVDYAPNCVEPTNVVCTGNTSSSVTLAWNPNGATAWEIAYDTADFTPTTGTAVTTNPYTVTGLTSGTTYYFYVRNDCGSDYSSWVGPVTATPGTWVMHQGQSDTISLCGGIIYDNGGPNGNYANNSNDVVVIRPDAPGMAVTLSGNYNIENNYEHLYIYDGEGTSAPQLGSYTGSGSVNVAATNASGSITVRFTSDGSVNSYYGFELNISCVSNSCPAVDSLTASNVAGTTATISWLPGSASSWIMEYGLSGFAEGTGTISTVTSATQNLTGLTYATAYDVYVTPICTGADTGRTSMISFTTTCFDGAIATFPWVEDFEGGLDCWDQQTVSGSNSWSTHSGNYSSGSIDAAYSGSNNAYFFAYGDASTYLISPVLDLSSASDSVLMTFYHTQQSWAGDQDTLGVYYRTCDTCDWTYVTSWSNEITSWQLDSVMLPNPSATYQVGFLGESEYGYGITIDSLVIYGPESSCPTPVITSTSVDYQSITATWSGSASSYEVAVMPLTSTTWPTATTVSGNTYTFGGLNAHTDYQFRVRALCDGGETSGWRTGYATTDSLPCFVPENVQVSNIGVSEATITWQNNPLASTSTFVVRIYNTTMEQMDTVEATTITFTGLYDNTTYNVTVMSLCAANVASEWSEPVSFTTSTCIVPTDVTVSDITATSATISWVAAGDETSWEINYGPAYFTSGNGTAVVVNTTSYTITGLVAEDEYDVYVRALCTETSNSEWTDVVRFETATEVGIDDVNGDSHVSVYPNPASSSTTIIVSGVEGKVTATLLDMSGRTLQSYQFECNGDCQQRIDVEGLAQGTYFVRLSSDKVNSVSKVIVK